jgi:hypothetical protein
VKITIKHTLLLILAMVLMLDLAEDGCFGQAKVDFPVALTKTSVTTSHHAGSGKVDSLHESPPANLCDSPGQANYQPVSFEVQPSLKIIYYRNTRSSGGIPL